MKNNKSKLHQSKLKFCLFSLVASSLITPFTVYSATISLTGDYGINGFNGVSGTPGTSAGAGGSGGSVSVIADVVTDASNTASAVGGSGGFGGSGGYGYSGTSGGDGGDSGGGGNASAAASTSVLSGSAFTTATAQGGNGGQSGVAGGAITPDLYGLDGSGGNGGSAFAEGTAIGSDSALVTVNAQGGTGGILRSSYVGAVGATAGNGGAATLGTVYGESTNGGYVDVRGTARGGSGGQGWTSTQGFGAGGNGAGSTLLNAVDGNTTGQLRLEQTAIGGSAGQVENGFNGIAGNAASSLTKQTSSWSLALDVNAIGGNGSSRSGSSGKAGPGGSAEVNVNGRNDSGSLYAKATATAGWGGSGGAGSNGGDGASASTVVVGETVGDVQRIDLNGVAYGGRGGSAGIGRFGGNGGNATSNTYGRALGNSVVFVSDRADGGNAGSVGSAIGNVGFGGYGGDAISTAIATNNGTATVDARSFAYAGNGGPAGIGGISGRAGNALSVAQGTGQGAVYASSFADSTAYFEDLGGNTRASSQAIGASGNAVAKASTEDYLFEANAQATATVAGNLTTGTIATSRAEAGISFGEPNYTTADAMNGHSVALATLLPNNATMDAIVAGNPNIQANLGYGNGDSLMVGLLGGAYSDGGAEDALATYSALLNFRIDMFELGSQENLLLGLYNPYGLGNGFDSLHFLVQVEGSSFIDETFTDMNTAFDYFNDNTLDLGLWSSYINGADLDLTISLDLTAQNIGDGFGFGMGLSNATMSAVPVPSAIWLFCSGLIGLIGIARRKV